jgi:hypothetical protein
MQFNAQAVWILGWLRSLMKPGQNIEASGAWARRAV